VVLGVVRHLLTLAGGVLVTRGTLDDGQLSEGVGALCALLAIAWSVQHKRRAGMVSAAPVAFALLGVLLFSNGCASASKVVTADIRLQCGTNVVTVSQPKDTVIDSLEFEPATGRLVLRGYQSTASAAAVESARAQAAIQGQVITAGLAAIESLAARAAQSQGIPMAPPPATVKTLSEPGTNGMTMRVLTVRTLRDPPEFGPITNVHPDAISRIPDPSSH
jgi:hypothetical protein